MNHFSDFEIQEYLSRLVEPVRGKEIEDHIRICRDCAAKVAGFQRLERELERVPPERVSKRFTGRVMRAIGLRSTSGLVRQLVVNLLPLAGAGLVVVFLAGFFSAPEGGASPGREVDRYADSFQQAMGRTVTDGTFLIAEGARRVVIFFASMRSVKFVMWILVAFAAVVVFDELVFLPMMKKRG